MDFNKLSNPLERLASAFEPSCPACLQLQAQGRDEACPDCEDSFDLREQVDAGGDAASERSLRNFPRLRVAFEQLERGEGTNEAVVSVLSLMQSKAQNAIRITGNLVTKEEDPTVRESLQALLAQMEEAAEREKSFLAWLQRGNLGAARYELDALRTALNGVMALDAAYKKTWRERYQQA